MVELGGTLGNAVIFGTRKVPFDQIDDYIDPAGDRVGELRSPSALDELQMM